VTAYRRNDDAPESCFSEYRADRCLYAEDAADRAVEKMVEKLYGVDLNNPEKVKKVQSLHNFVERLERITEKSILAATATLAAMFVGAVLLGIKTKMMGP
jgi:hypothetical protein